MGLSTYTELKAAIATRLHRTDLTTQIVDYITIAEKRLNRALRLTSQETEATLTATVGSRSLTLPSLFGSPLDLYLTTYLPRIELQYRLPGEMQAFSSNGASNEWTIDGTVIKTNVPADIAYTYTLRYLSKFDIATTSTNTLLTSYPELYLYGALIEAAGDTQNDKLLSFCAARYAQALQECQDNSHAMRSLASLTTDIGTSQRSNIFGG